MIITAQSGTTPWSYAPPSTGIVNTTTAVTIKAATTGQRNYITDLHIAHSTLGAAVELGIRDGAAGTVIFRTAMNVTANDGQTISLKTPLFSSVGTLLEVVLSGATTGGVYVNAQGFSA